REGAVTERMSNNLVRAQTVPPKMGVVELQSDIQMETRRLRVRLIASTRIATDPTRAILFGHMHVRFSSKGGRPKEKSLGPLLVAQVRYRRADHQATG